MARENQVSKPVLRSLLRDRTANTIAVSAAAMVPLMAMVGGGIDASRYYMAAARMQQACDAGALAARRAMLDDEFRAEHRNIGLNFFDQNFNDGIFGTEGRTRDYTSDGDGVVTGTASGTLPASIMAAFGYNEFQLNVTCSAEINISNTDIMFVLDVTGSMNCPDNNIAGCTNGNNNNNEVSNSLIVGLRDAVMNFYDTVETATSASAQVRYGVVPYAHTVNVGFDLPRQFLANTHSYQSRVARFREDITFIPGNGIEEGDEIVISDAVEPLPRNTARFGSNSTGDYRYRNSGTTQRNTAQNFCWNVIPGTYTVGSETWQVSNTEYRFNMWTGGNSNNRAGCVGRVRKTRIATPADVVEDQTIRNIVPDGYTYCRVTPGALDNCGVTNPEGSPAGWETVDLSTLYDDNQIMLPTGTDGAFVNHTWNGCIEEAGTVNTATWDPVPANAHDLNINLLPTTEAQRWKPQLHNAVWRRFDSGGNAVTGNVVSGDNNNWRHIGYNCVRRAMTLREIERADLRAYVDALRASGATYHDIGMIWGARFIAPRGIFRATNETAPNGDAIGRHIVFMTDGALAPNPGVYSPYGVEPWDRRVTADGVSNAHNRHEARFQAACRAARQENITIWVVAFGTNLTASLIECASPGRAYQASNNAALNTAFQEIAQKIAALRLTQ